MGNGVSRRGRAGIKSDSEKKKDKKGKGEKPVNRRETQII